MAPQRTSPDLIRENKRKKAQVQELTQQLKDTLEDFEKVKGKLKRMTKAYKSEFIYVDYTLFHCHCASPGYADGCP